MASKINRSILGSGPRLDVTHITYNMHTDLSLKGLVFSIKTIDLVDLQKLYPNAQKKTKLSSLEFIKEIFF
jgi:hypothetical protein